MDNQIRKYRKILKLTQAELGQAVGISARTIHNVETGLFDTTVEKGLLIAKALGQPIEDIFLLGLQK